MNCTSSLKSASVSPGKPTMKVVRMEMFVAGDFVERADEGGKGFAFAAVDAAARFRALLGPLVHAEVGRVLRDEIDLLDAAFDELTDFLDDAFLRAAAMAAADARDDAE
jgi:hypothetical protein